MSETPETKQPETKSGKGASVFTYLAIMFAAAFLMLLLAYFIQQRNNEVAMDGLKDSISSFESLDELWEENQSLRDELTQAETQTEALEEEITSLQEEISRLEGELEGANRRYEDLRAGWEEENLFSSVLASLYFAETEALAGNYTAAAGALADWNTAYLEKAIEVYDAKYYFDYNPEGIYLRPHYDALVTSLIGLGYLVQGEDGSLTASSPVE